MTYRRRLEMMVAWVLAVKVLGRWDSTCVLEVTTSFADDSDVQVKEQENWTHQLSALGNYKHSIATGLIGGRQERAGSIRSSFWNMWCLNGTTVHLETGNQGLCLSFISPVQPQSCPFHFTVFVPFFFLTSALVQAFIFSYPGPSCDPYCCSSYTSKV